MVDLPAVFCREVPSAPGAAPALALQQTRDLPGPLGMASHPGGPIRPVAVIGALLASNLHVSADRRVRVPRQRDAVGGREGPVSAFEPPVFPDDPIGGLLLMATLCPATQLQVDQ